MTRSPARKAAPDTPPAGKGLQMRASAFPPAETKMPEAERLAHLHMRRVGKAEKAAWGVVLPHWVLYALDPADSSGQAHRGVNAAGDAMPRARPGGETG